jgi:hypothetical protein
MLQSCSEKLAVNRKNHFNQAMSVMGQFKSRLGSVRVRRSRSDQPVKTLQIASVNIAFVR